MFMQPVAVVSINDKIKGVFSKLETIVKNYIAGFSK